MGKTTKMITVGGVMSLAQRNLNTIRYASLKYLDLRPGDQAKMSYGPDIDDTGRLTRVVATEFLTVCSVALAKLDDIIRTLTAIRSSSPSTSSPTCWALNGIPGSNHQNPVP